MRLRVVSRPALQPAPARAAAIAATRRAWASEVTRGPGAGAGGCLRAVLVCRTAPGQNRRFARAGAGSAAGAAIYEETKGSQCAELPMTAARGRHTGLTGLGSRLRTFSRAA